MNPSNSRSASKWFYLVGIMVVVVCAYLLITSVNIANKTGVLSVSTPNSKTAISISQENKQAYIIGAGRANIRLNPGIYTVVASQNDKEIFKDVRITKKQTTKINLDPKNGYVLPSVLTINFAGFDELIEKGLTASQVNKLKNSFFRFKSNSKNIAIRSGSLIPAPRNPNTAVGFDSSFVLSIDSVTYKAKIHYSDPASPIGIRLYVYNNAGTLLFDSGMI